MDSDNLNVFFVLTTHELIVNCTPVRTSTSTNQYILQYTDIHIDKLVMAVTTDHKQRSPHV